MNLTPEDREALAKIEDLRAIPRDDNSEELDALEREAEPCPHCTGRGWFEENNNFWYITTDCGARGPCHKDPEGAVRLWNRLAER